MLHGNSQQFIYGIGPEQLTLALDNDNFVPLQGGEGHLAQLGYDRRDRPDDLPTIDYSAMGAAIRRGPCYLPRQEFDWNLRLSLAEFLILWAIVQRQQAGGEPCYLNDQRLALLAATPRPRARAAALTSLPAPPGTEIFWPRFAVQLALAGDWAALYNCALTEGSVALKLSGLELDLLTPAEDAA